jgi:hypothetical protein
VEVGEGLNDGVHNKQFNFVFTSTWFHFLKYGFWKNFQMMSAFLSRNDFAEFAAEERRLLILLTESSGATAVSHSSSESLSSLATFFLLLGLFPLFGLKSALLPRWAFLKRWNNESKDQLSPSNLRYIFIPFCFAFVYGTNHYNNKRFTRDLLFQLSSEAILPARKKMRMKRG